MTVTTVWPIEIRPQSLRFDFTDVGPLSIQITEYFSVTECRVVVQWQIISGLVYEVFSES